MASGIPHSSILREQLQEFLGETTKEVERNCARVAKQADYSGIFRNSTAAFAVLKKWARGNGVSYLSTAATVVRRCPLLLAVGQFQLAQIELRRFAECVGRYPYFVDHPIEWEHVLANPASAITRDDDNPIAWSANREQRWYLDYILARYKADKSNLVRTAVEDLGSTYREMSAHVHTALESAGRSSIDVAVGTPTLTQLASFREAQRRAYAAGVIVSLVARPSGLGRLTAMERSWFDWLIGADAAKLIRGGALL